VVSGGNIYSGVTPLLNDRLYVNDGRGKFSVADNLPPMTNNKSVACAADIDHDGDMDIFVGGRSVSRNYSKTPSSYLLMNDGKGKFSLGAEALTAFLQQLGMVTDASFTDVDKDGWQDLIVVGEWMQPVLFKNVNGSLKRQPLTTADDKLTGWWSVIQATDINGDGYQDLLLGNYGLNSKLTASREYPLEMFSQSMSGIGYADQILAVEKDQKYYPFLNKEDIEKQLPYLKKKFLMYGEMAGKTVEEIFGEKLNGATVFKASTLASIVLLNNGKGHFTPAPLPASFQWTPIFSFVVNDYNGDGKQDIMAGGNFFGTTPHEGRYDAMPLSFGLGDGQGKFNALMPVPVSLSKVNGEVRSISFIKLADNKKGLLMAVNNDSLRLFEYGGLK